MIFFVSFDDNFESNRISYVVTSPLDIFDLRGRVDPLEALFVSGSLMPLMNGYMVKGRRGNSSESPMIPLEGISSFFSLFLGS